MKKESKVTKCSQLDKIILKCAERRHSTKIKKTPAGKAPGRFQDGAHQQSFLAVLSSETGSSGSPLP